jgi:putative spermidine/putrescine transport system permease protein
VKRFWFILIMVLLFVLPILLFVLQSFSARWAYPDLLPEVFNLRSWVVVLTESPAIFQGIGSSLLLAFLTVLLSLALCLPAARTLVWFKVPGRSFWEALLLIPAVIPPITLAMGVHTLMIRMGLTDTVFGVVLVLTFFAYPYMLRALIAGYETIPQNLMVTAENLGAGFWRRTFSLEIPLLLPAISSGGMVVFLVAFSDYLMVKLIGGGSVQSITLVVVPYLRSDFTLASAMVLVFLLVPLLLFFLMEGFVQSWYRKRGL